MVKLNFLAHCAEYGIRAGEQVWFDAKRAAKLIESKIAEAIDGDDLPQQPAAKADPAPDPKADAQPAKKGK